MRGVVLPALFVAFAVAALVVFGALHKEPPPPPPPVVDPRIDVGPLPPPPPPFGGGPSADVKLEEIDEGERFAHALTAHRRKNYVGDLDDIQKRGVLRVLTRNNATSYFLYRGVEAGFDYEVAQWIAQELGVRLEMVVAPTRRELVPWLLDGKGDVILAGLSVNAARADRVLFTRPYLETSWVVVTRKRNKKRLASVGDLAGVELLVRPSSSAMLRLRAMKLPGISLRGALETMESEDLLDAVSDKEATAALVEERVAKVELMHRPELKVAFTMPWENDASGLAVRKEDAKLHAALDDFVKRHRKTTDWNVMYKRYHSLKDRTAAVRDENLRADREGLLSPWDDLFKKAGAEADVDWRLLVAQAYQESRFNPEARSPFGALGLMQLLPSTAKSLGCDDPKNPKGAIRAAARYLGQLMKRHEGEADVVLQERVRFALAAYNVGPSHLDDARDLATSLGLDRNRWFGHVETAAALLSKPRHYQALKHGYARGDETVRYVSEIQTRYDAYVALTTPGPTAKK